MSVEIKQGEMLNSYDELKYYSKAFSFCSIASLEAKGRFWGLTPSPIEGARVLELGSSFGGNLISQALYYPEAQFVGVDLSRTQIEQGNDIIKAMGLNNVKLFEKNILDITPEFGEFDYIIVHGIYSWVPDMVKEKILEICRENLSENGLAYISYNTYPGWKNKEVARDIMLFTNKYQSGLSLQERTHRGRTVLGMVENVIKENESIKGKNIARFDNFNDIQQKDTHYIAHEYLEEINHPLYLHEFVDQVRAKNLAYIGDLELKLSFISWVHKNIREMLKKLSPSDYIVREQLLDYIYDVEFRRSLLCHKEKREQINRSEEVPKAILDNFYYSSNNKNIELENLLDDQELIKVFKKFFMEDDLFTIKEISEYIVFNNLESKLSLDKVYSGLLLLIVLGNVQFYNKAYLLHGFEDNKTYVPEKFIRYVGVMLEQKANEFISFGDMYNRNLYFIDHLHYFVMQKMAQPTTKEKIEIELKNYLIQIQAENVDENTDLSHLVKNIFDNLSQVGYIQPYSA